MTDGGRDDAATRSAPAAEASALALACGPLRLAGRDVPRRAVITASVMLGIFLAAVEATVVGTAMPTIAQDLAGLTLYGIASASYLIASACLVPIWGRLADLHGRVRFYVAGLALFLVGSGLAGAARSMPEFIAFRALQGAGAASVMAIGFTIVGDIFTLEERARVQGWLSGVWGVSSVIGPFAGWVCTDFLSWRWAFYLNVPPGILAGALLVVAWREPPRSRRDPTPILGMVLLLLALATLFAALSLTDFPLAARAGLAALAAALGTAVYRVERASSVGVLDVALFSNPTFRAVALGGVFSGIAMFASIIYAPLFAQGVLGTSPLGAALVLMPLFVVWSAASAVSGRLALRFGFRTLALAGSAFCTAAYAIFTSLDEGSSLAVLIAAQPILGVGLGFTVAPLLILVQSSVPRAQRGSATALTQFSRQLGGAIGVAAIGGILATGLAKEIVRLGVAAGLDETRARFVAQHVNEAVAGRIALAPGEPLVLRQALGRSLHLAFATALAASLALVLVTFLVPSGRPGAAEPDGL